MSSGFNETQWVDWTCSFTRGGGGVWPKVGLGLLRGGVQRVGSVLIGSLFFSASGFLLKGSMLF